MDSPDLSRRFVQLLLDWATAPPESRDLKRGLMDPANEFWPWIYGLIEAYYRPSFNHFWGMVKAEFRDRCVAKVFAWVKAKVERLQPTDYTDHDLEASIRTIALHEQITAWRRMRKLSSLDIYLDDAPGSGEATEPTRREVPAGLRVDPFDLFASPYERLHAEFRHARLVMPFFNRSLRGKTSMRQVLAWLLCLGRRLGRKKGFPAHWYVYRVLRRRGKHLPVYLRGFLKNHLPHLSYGVINSRLGYLRRAFIKFSVQENVSFV